MDHLTSIRAFVTVAKLGSFTKAADALSTSKAQISRAVTALEKHTHSRLIKRTTRQVALAEGARRYYETCVRVITELHAVEQQLAEDKKVLDGQVSLVAHPLAVACGLSDLLLAFTKRAPGVDVEVTISTASLDLESSDCDIALYPPQKILNASAISRPLFQSPHILVASPAYLARTPTISSLPDLSAHTIICLHSYENGKCEPSLRERELLNRLRLPRYRFYASESAAKDLALSDAGVALLPECVVAACIKLGRLEQVLAAEPLIQERAELSVHYVQKRLMSRRTRELVEESIRFFTQRQIDVEPEKLHLAA
jgi:DNA-binding transcriptional LysR family regulator